VISSSPPFQKMFATRRTTEALLAARSTTFNPCGKSLPRGGSAKANGMRRYVIDEVTGSVDVLCQFDSLGAWPDSHEIRVVDGKVKYVHTVTVMRGVGS
jgi:hypothetical protein